MATDNTIRQVAHKTSIGQMLNGKYVQSDDKNPNYFILDDQPVYKVNVVAIVIHKETVGAITNLLLDDGTGRITTRFFEENPVATNATIGDALLLTGRVRLYNQERYLSPEIVKKVDKVWLQVRRQECKSAFTAETVKKAEVKETQEDTVVDEEIAEVAEVQDNLLPSQKISRIIRDLDKGGGVFIEEIIEKSPLDHTEQIIEKMLERGEIFQNQPGKVKVL